MNTTIRLGAGAGFAGDRIDPAAKLAAHAGLDYLVFEVLGERTIAAANSRKISHNSVGFDPLLQRRLEASLKPHKGKSPKIITNGGAADPRSAGQAAVETARRLGLDGLLVATVLGDDVRDVVREIDPVVWESGTALSNESAELVSANAYIGSAPIVEALDEGAQVVIGGRIADPALYLAPMIHEFGWATEGAEDLLGKGTMVGHLLECAGQLTGGYFADPVTKPVPGLADLGFPFADVANDGEAVFSKLSDTGGVLNCRTATEQLLYEVGDPSRYVTPDVTADFTNVRFKQTGTDQVHATGATGTARPDELKVTLGFKGGWLGEGQISYAGTRATERAKLASEIVLERLHEVHGINTEDLSVELIGTGAAFRNASPTVQSPEVRLRIAGRVDDQVSADAIGWEVEALYTNGPAGGGGARRSVSDVLAVRSCTVPRSAVTTRVEVLEA